MDQKNNKPRGGQQRRPQNNNNKPIGNLIQAFIKTLSAFIENSQETTLQGLNISVKEAANYLCNSKSHFRNYDKYD